MDNICHLVKSLAEVPQWMLYTSAAVLAAVYLPILGIDRAKLGLEESNRFSKENEEMIMVVSGSAGGGV